MPRKWLNKMEYFKKQLNKEMKKKLGKIITPSFLNRFAKIRLKSESIVDR